MSLQGNHRGWFFLGSFHVSFPDENQTVFGGVQGRPKGTPPIFRDPRNSDMGMGHFCKTRIWAADFSPCVHVPGQAILGLPKFEPQPSSCMCHGQKTPLLGAGWDGGMSMIKVAGRFDLCLCTTC